MVCVFLKQGEFVNFALDITFDRWDSGNKFMLSKQYPDIYQPQSFIHWKAWNIYRLQ